MRDIILLNSSLFGLGLAVEAFMVAVANGLSGQNTRFSRGVVMAAVFAACHSVALGIGFGIVRALANGVGDIDKYLSRIAVGVLLLLGTKSIIASIVEKEKARLQKTSALEFFVQSIVASFDAFAVGLSIADYSTGEWAFCASVIFGIIVTAFIFGYVIGRKFGVKLADKSGIVGGLVFIGIAIEIAVTSAV